MKVEHSPKPVVKTGMQLTLDPEETQEFLEFMYQHATQGFPVSGRIYSEMYQQGWRRAQDV